MAVLPLRLYLNQGQAPPKAAPWKAEKVVVDENPELARPLLIPHLAVSWLRIIAPVVELVPL